LPPLVSHGLNTGGPPSGGGGGGGPPSGGGGGSAYPSTRATHSFPWKVHSLTRNFEVTSGVHWYSVSKQLGSL